MFLLRGAGLSGTRRCAGSKISRNVDHVIGGQFFDDRFHEARPLAFTESLLHVEQLANDVTRRSAGESGNRTESFQICAMADTALGGLVGRSRHESLPFFECALWNVGDEAGAGITQNLGVFVLFGNFNDALSN